MGDELVPIRLFDDEPPRQDEPERVSLGGRELSIGAEAWAKTVARCILGVRGPFGVGIFGPWGKGKTSLIQRVMHLVANATSYRNQSNQLVTIENSCVYVNAWTYERHDDPLLPILTEIYAELDDAGTGKRKARRAVGLILASLVASHSISELLHPHGEDNHTHSDAEDFAKELMGAEPIFDGEDPPKNFKDFIKRFYWRYVKNPGDSVRRVLDRPAAADLKEEKVVIFVDDLDRCHPDNALKILEALKLLLWHEGFVFVLALDDKVITDYLCDVYEKRYGFKASEDEDHAKAKNMGQKYLEKIIQLAFPIPRYDPGQLDSFYDELQGGFVGTLELGRALELLKGSLIRGSHGNPRGLKRLMNTMLIDATMYEESQGQALAESDIYALAINRILPDEIGRDRFNRLVESQEVCDLVLILVAEEGDPRDPHWEAQELREESKSEASAIYRTLEAVRLTRLFEGPGQGWLRSEELRFATRSFLVAQRGAEIEVPEEQRTIVDRAIRIWLDLAIDQPITEEHRRLIKTLDLSSQPLDSSGLQLLNGLSALQSLNLQGTQVSDVAPLASLTALKSLDLQGTQVSDVTPLASLTALKSLDLDGTQVSDVAPLASLSALLSLDLRGTQVSDVTPLVSLTALKSLYLQRTQVSDVTPLASLTGLKSLYLQGTQVSDIAPLASLTALKSLYLQGTQVSDIAPLASLTALETLDLQRTHVSDVAPLASLTALKSLHLPGTQVSDVAPLASLTALETLSLQGTQVSDIAPLASLTALETLFLQGTQVSDVAPLASLTALKSLYLPGTQVSDVAPLASLTALETLYLPGTQVSDVTPLASLTGLKSLYLQRTQVSDVTPLASLTGLKSLYLQGTQVSDVAPLASLTALETLDLQGTQVSDITPLAELANLRTVALGGSRVTDLGPIASNNLRVVVDLLGSETYDPARHARP